MSHGVLNKRPMIWIVAKAQGGISSSSGILVRFPLNGFLFRKLRQNFPYLFYRDE
jgi:hypothetical protein